MIGRSVWCNKLAKLWNDIEGVLAIDFSEDSVLNFGELQAHEPASEFKHSFCLFQRPSCTGDIPQAKGNSIGIEGRGVKWKFLCIGTNKLYIYNYEDIYFRMYIPFPAPSSCLPRALKSWYPALSIWYLHRVNITSSFVVFQDLKSDIPCPSGNIKHPHQWLLLLVRVDSWGGEYTQLIHEMILPISMYPHGHEIIHDVVFVGHRVEDLIDKRLLLFSCYVFEPEVVILLVGESKGLGG